MATTINCTKETPMQGHLSLTNTPTEMRLTWDSGVKQSSVIRYGAHSNNYTSESFSEVSTYKAPCGDPENFIDPGYVSS
jgi:hypothetical protein